MDFDLIDDTRPRLQLNSGPVSSSSHNSSERNVNKIQVGICCSIGVALIGFGLTSVAPLQFLAMGLRLSLIVGPLAPISLTGGDCRVGIGEPILSLEEEERPQETTISRVDNRNGPRKSPEILRDANGTGPPNSGSQKTGNMNTKESREGVGEAEDKAKLTRMLVEEGQAHLFAKWPAPGIRDADKLGFFDQVAKLDSNYPGGLTAYIRNARKLLADSKAGKNPFSGYVPSVPDGEKLVVGEEKFMQYEEAGVIEAQYSAFVLVAGGLGERLGYSGIKVALPAETTTETSFLQLYVQTILALQHASNRGQSNSKKPIPFVIMTSDDTHQQTRELLETNKNFGMLPDQIVLLKQEKVACLSDNNALLAVDPSNSFLIQTKPHGHGDVHNLLYKSGLLSKWQQDGVKWVLLFQDTNGLLFKGIPASLGVSALKDLDVNSLAVNRKAKEAIGGIARLTHENGSEMVINVEYNQLDPLLRATGHGEGDVNDETGFSPFPGNINQLVLKLSSYVEELSRTNGAIVEFVNPKYKDASKTSFKSSTRLECMMQDYPRTLSSSAKVGFTVLETWLAYAPVKNNPEDAAKVPRGNPTHSATSGEMAIYRANCLILQKAGVNIEGPKIETYNGQEVEVWPRIVWSPKWALRFSDVKQKVKGLWQVSQRSTLVLDGENVTIDSLVLDGALFIRAAVGSEVNIKSLRVSNDGWDVIPVDFKDKHFAEETRIRGFGFERLGEQTLFFDQPGKCYIDNVSLVVKH